MQNVKPRNGRIVMSSYLQPNRIDSSDEARRIRFRQTLRNHIHLGNMVIGMAVAERMTRQLRRSEIRVAFQQKLENEHKAIMEKSNKI